MIQGKNVLAIEPSPEMRRIAKSKPSLSKVTFVDGDMEVFPEITDAIDTPVPSFSHALIGTGKPSFSRFAHSFGK